MDGFGRYVEKRRQKQDMTAFYEQKQQVDISGAEKYELKNDSVESIRYRYQERLDTTDFQDREFYYFKDQTLLEKKAEKYRRMANDENQVMTRYADRYEYRSARKRKGYAKDASKAFNKALNKERSLDESGKTPLEKYKAREEIMRIRLDGMIAVAKTKAKNKDNEKYRISKAKYSCLMVLKDQLDHLLGKRAGEDYEEIKTKLDKEISDALSTLRKYSPNAADRSEERWREVNGLNDEENVNELLEEAREINPEITKEDVIIRERTLRLEAEITRPELMDAFRTAQKNGVYGDKPLVDGNDQDRVFMFMCHYIKRDANGRPINNAEQKKAEWNQKWFDTVSDPTKVKERNEMIEQKFKEIVKFELPSPAELKEKGVWYFYNKDPFGFAKMVQESVALDNFREHDPFAQEYYKTHPKLRTFFEATKWLGTIFKTVCSFEHHFDMLHGGAEYLDKESCKLNLENYLTSAAYWNEEYENEYNKLHGLVNEPLSYEYAHDLNENLTKEGYEIYTTAKKENQHLHNPEIRAKWQECLNKTAPGSLMRTADMEISRGLGLLLENVHYDKNWKPLTKEDEQKHKANLEMIEKAMTCNEQEFREIVIEKLNLLNKLVQSIKWPTPEELKAGWLTGFVKNSPQVAAELSKLTLCIPCIWNEYPWVKEMIKTDPAYKELDLIGDVFAPISQGMTFYFSGKYGIELKNSADAQISPAEYAKVYMQTFDAIVDGEYKEKFEIYQKFKGDNK